MSWKHWILGAAFGLLLSVDGWAGQSRLAVDLTWSHLPRDTESVKQGAKLPNGALVYQVFSDGSVAMTVHLDGGTRCQTMVAKAQVLFLTCGTEATWYSITKVPGNQTSVDLVTTESAPIVKGSAS